jgi:transposase-like protein
VPTQAVDVDALLVLFLTVLFFSLLFELSHFDNCSKSPTAPRRGPRPLRPRTPDDCQLCRAAAIAPSPTPVRSVIPYAQRKSPRGRKKRIDTRGQACPNPKCDYRDITDPAVHARVGYGHHGQHEPIQDFYCQACQRKFSARRHTPLYRLRAPAARVAQVLHAVAEGLSAQAAARVFQLSETTVRNWITRAGQHSQSLHERFMRALQLSHVQLDELRLKLRGVAEAAWLWVACDARTKIIPAFVLGPRTQAMAHQLVHEVAQWLAPGCLPISLAPRWRAAPGQVSQVMA